MSDFIVIDNQSTRYDTLQKGFNLRFPENGEGADFICICKTAQEVIDAANYALQNGYRLTVRSGGHCYEGFVSNKLSSDGGQLLAIIDLGLMTGMQYSEAGDISSPWDNTVSYCFSAATGNQNWDGYVSLYKLSGKTVPGGSCYSVGSGGHVSGGGYGLLSRLHGLTVDWLSGVDILVPDTSGGSGLVVKHVHLNSTGSDRDLFIACRGGGGGNFGIILNYYYADLPHAPQQAYLLSLSWPWESFGTGEAGKAAFGNLLHTYWKWFADHDGEWNSDDPTLANGGLFTLLKLQHRSTGDVVMTIQYTGLDGTVGGLQDQPFIDFVNTMTASAGVTPYLEEQQVWHGAVQRTLNKKKTLRDPVSDSQLMDWLWLTETINGSGGNMRNKYKSAYHVADFTDVEISALWSYLNISEDVRLNQAWVQMDSYGGCINSNDETSNPTSVYQRSSLLKSQFQLHWNNVSDDDFCMTWLTDLYSAYFSRTRGKPTDEGNGRYQGCYINYPDVDMKYTDMAHTDIDPQWLVLYYGDKASDLVTTKQLVDPDNIFHHEMSIPLSLP
ncbi:BBE domain-containing protein [[Enterobacter] lignolyticus]|uniref:FAD-binding protein n=1 Tax=[Enterobacter] lignolyticus TaxID=1334193 RepID=A0A806X994_9ENTR|nr:BBE domain-containing protein [[Enterobacter] lignolyticus]ALR75259.1 FAD-binding protein [[Enterobacter] lignolyticus]